MSNFFIKQKHLEKIISIFDKNCPKAEVWAYGSRVNGDAHDGSDLDLIVKNLSQCNISLNDLKNIIKESNIPFLVDIADFENIPDSFIEIINKNYIMIYPVK